MIVFWCVLFFGIGFACGIRAAVAVANMQVKKGEMFFKKGGVWYGDGEAIKRDIEAKRGI